MTVLDNIIDVFLAPGKTFERIDEKPMILMPIVLIVLVAITMMGLNFNSLIEDQQELLIETSKINQEPIAAEDLSRLARTSAYSALVFTGPIFILSIIVKTLFSRGLATLMSGKGTFKKLFSALLFAYMIMILGMVISSILMFAFGLEYLSFSPAMFFEGLVGKPWYVFFSAIDLFTVWYLLVSAIAIQKIEKIGMPQALVCSVIPFLTMVSFNVIVTMWIN